MRYQQSDPDVRLMLRVKDDDAGAFEELVQRYQGRLVRLMEHLGPRRDLADDMTQEVFLRVFRARKSYQPGAKFSTWLFTIAGNVARNTARSTGRRREVSEVDAGGNHSGSQPAMLASVAVDASGLMPTRVIEGAERAEVVRAAVQMLSDRQREALLLSKFEGLSYLEIAEVMQLTTKAVKSLLSRARVNLKELLVPYVDAGVIPAEAVGGAPSRSTSASKEGD
ncbi:RNA polymerase sigma factor [Roseimaritima ulvae]|uniref:ECF RNA polymerase sigma-E factor n=1 Tax=Roseimaritima ulvae TaxID=980254 RepID=A0A5B9QIX7_9BACT|nr:sigma-70 family RNA polymerase sigma factor [Roseimaritima ulvae]QEG38988.1 ECF RNA polymerase sigma-E factor [Roseimaritima ulvae]